MFLIMAEMQIAIQELIKVYSTFFHHSCTLLRVESLWNILDRFKTKPYH